MGSSAEGAAEDPGDGLFEEYVEGVGFTAALVVFDEDDGGTFGAGFVEEVLGASAVDAAETEGGGDGGHGTVAIEAAPGGGAAFAGVDFGHVAADFDFGDAVDYEFQSALAAAATAVDVGRADLGGEGGGEG